MALDVATETLRNQTLDAARRYKASWIELGQYLQSIYKDKLFKTWGFLAFETYCKKELGIKETTAAKLMKSYSYLEKEEPTLVQASLSHEEEAPAVIPHYESVNLLRLARNNKNITPQDFSDIRASVIKNGREPKEVRAQVRQLLSEREDRDPAEVRRSRRNSAIKRIITVIHTAKKELESEKLIPEYLLKQMSQLVDKLQDQIED